MSFDDVMDLIRQMNLPFAYDHFNEGSAPALPFVIFRFPNSNNFSADGKVYQKIDVLNIELYSNKKDPLLETRIERILDAYELFYEKSETFIESEKMYQVLFEMEVVING